MNRILHPYLFVLALLGLAVGSLAQVPEFRLKQHPDDVVGLIRSEVAFGHFPFDKPYPALTPQQQQQFKSLYVAMADADEPPFPLHGLQEIYSPISRAQQRLRVEGEVAVDVQVDAKGDGVSLKVLKSPSPEFTRFLASVVLSIRYKPALCGGATCAMELPVRVKLRER